MTLVQRSRFAAWLKNLAGYRGSFGLSLDGGISPVYDFSSRDPELDDETGYWLFSATQTAVAAQFSQVQVKLVPGSPAFARAIVDGFIIRPQTGGTLVQAGLAAEIAGAGSAVVLANNFMGQRTGVFTTAAVSLGAVVGLTNTQAASPFPVAPLQLDNPAVANGSDSVFLLTPLGFVLTPGFAFSIIAATVNSLLAVDIWGRFRADQQ